MKKTGTLLYLLVALIGIASFAGCNEQLPIMTVAQQTTYNDCMSGRWSGAADTFWWGSFGWAYHSSLVKDCLAKSGSIGEIGSAEAAPTTAVGSVQPAATRVTAATSGAQPHQARRLLRADRCRSHPPGCLWPRMAAGTPMSTRLPSLCLLFRPCEESAGK